jgi:hypothetical protein
LKLTRYPAYWRSADLEGIKNARTYAALSVVGLNILERMKTTYSSRMIGIVCGPISSGGLGSREKNLEVFEEYIQDLLRRNVLVFNQMPFEEKLLELLEGDLEKNGFKLLTGFYLPLFESGLIDYFYFIPGWKTSNGANWEKDQAERLGKTIVQLPKL